jgi:hypothetical protein
MSNQEKWDELVQKIQDLGDELLELSEGQPDDDGEFEMCMLGLNMTIDDLREKELD